LESAKQVIHRRQQPEPMMQSKINQPPEAQMLPKQATMVQLPATPLVQSKVASNQSQFLSIPKMMTPMSGQHFQIQTPSNQLYKPGSMIMLPQESPFFQHQHNQPPQPNPFFKQQASTSRNPQAPLIGTMPPSPANFQVLHKVEPQ
jgi:hypothetical protein